MNTNTRMTPVSPDWRHHLFVEYIPYSWLLCFDVLQLQNVGLFTEWFQLWFDREIKYWFGALFSI